jgi:MFS family permease
MPAAFLLGLAGSIALVAARLTLTEIAPPGQQARVHAVQGTLSEAALILPLLAAGVGTQYAGAQVSLAVVAAVGVVLFAAMELARALLVPADPLEVEEAAAAG